jgi:hypothetical protein
MQRVTLRAAARPERHLRGRPGGGRDRPAGDPADKGLDEGARGAGKGLAGHRVPLSRTHQGHGDRCSPSPPSRGRARRRRPPPRGLRRRTRRCRTSAHTGAGRSTAPAAHPAWSRTSRSTDGRCPPPTGGGSSPRPVRPTAFTTSAVLVGSSCAPVTNPSYCPTRPVPLPCRRSGSSSPRARTDDRRGAPPRWWTGVRPEPASTHGDRHDTAHSCASRSTCAPHRAREQTRQPRPPSAAQCPAPWNHPQGGALSRCPGSAVAGLVPVDVGGPARRRRARARVACPRACPRG